MNKIDSLAQIIQQYPQLKYSLLEAQTFNQAHYGFPEVYYDLMESDTARVGAFQRAFEQYNMLKDAVVCEAGVGRLVLSKCYLPFVKKAYLIENNPAIIPFIEAEIEKNNWQHKVELIVGDAMEVELPEPIDFLIAETMSIFCANEYQVQIFQHLRQYLKPSGKLIPEKILNWIQLGHCEFDEGIYHYPINFSRHLPTLQTNQVLLNTINLYTETEEIVQQSTDLQVYLSGLVNCVFLRSWIQLVEGVNFTGTDSLMPPTVVQLSNPFDVQQCTQITLQSEFTYGKTLDDAIFKILNKKTYTKKLM